MTPLQIARLKAIHGAIREEVRLLEDFIKGKFDPYSTQRLELARLQLNNGLLDLERLCK